MSQTKLPDEFVTDLLAQDRFLDSPACTEHRRKLLERLAQAKAREQRARRLAVTISVGCLLVCGLVYAVALSKFSNGMGKPSWLLNVLALVFLLSPVATALFLGLYFFRYRLNWVQARRHAREQALLEIPRQIAELRNELKKLRQRADPAPAPEPSPGHPGTTPGNHR